MEIFDIPSSQVYTPKLVVDPYSNKFYGESSYGDYATAVKGAISHYSKIIEQAKQPSSAGFFSDNLNQQEAFSLSNMFGTKVDKAKDAATKLASVRASSSSVNEGNYIQKEQINASYAANKEGWDKYFEGNYKNPRIAESDASGAQFQSNAPSALAMKGNTTSRNPKTIGTGTGLTSVGLNPFGRLDAGLGI